MSQNGNTTTATTANNNNHNNLVLEKSSNTVGLQVDLHPLVLINISDHFTRAKVENTNSVPRVIGLISGLQNGRVIEVCNSFELVLTKDGTLDLEYLKKKNEQFKKVFATYDILGWYSTGSQVSQSDLLLHKQIMEFNESPLYLMLDTNAAFTQAYKDLPVIVYESELHIVNDQPTTLFVKTPFKIQTGEAERIGVNHIAKVTPSGSEGSSRM
ncbi:Mov34/MPN/PAD-1 family protein [Cavenderia fasciculata]|uniref:COP9 signalosome complex subunit 6 n=1 Tax=Cavenderia fasciculata TaxID=261658 RepID=F4Q333_CACFS|nr:Mov34/MPN/PAD-1 family protein [Cavenderia fasciculata]EGG16755.1 Mov34/MPN/PAD-1 family protein [Cavenderia fasciculata]|eukprot:XP_004355229.1 Mov34/MPN/PAD-1 family protein [Cavenderia fasciculata]